MLVNSCIREVDRIWSQLEAVEESKKLLTSEVVLLRKQLAESIEGNGSLRQEKDVLETRASEFAVERAELRATLDTLQAEKVCYSDIGGGGGGGRSFSLLQFDWSVPFIHYRTKGVRYLCFNEEKMRFRRGEVVFYRLKIRSKTVNVDEFNEEKVDEGVKTFRIDTGRAARPGDIYFLFYPDY
ncbi:hypothetical protein E2C01_029140 [Portunus trituberculatus]|uniref:Uncharacterized protein n=1 Tax=Portunus trituberculatus TaxID=210409 RepID=A0A5B7ERG3_PORTR|nr:hypothetical protein [Portunus trituberculatus]